MTRASDKISARASDRDGGKLVLAREDAREMMTKGPTKGRVAAGLVAHTSIFRVSKSYRDHVGISLLEKDPLPEEARWPPPSIARRSRPSGPVDSRLSISRGLPFSGEDLSG